MISIRLRNRHVDYNFNIYDKFTIIRGDSGSGKTTLFNLVSSYNIDESSVMCGGYKNIYAVGNLKTEDDYKNLFSEHTDWVFVIDEYNKMFTMFDFEKTLKESNNYFIIINREQLFNHLPIHLRSIVNIKSSGKYNTLVQMCNIPHDINDVSYCITEDQKAGKAFLSQYVKNTVSSEGKDNIASFIENATGPVLVAFDVAGIGDTYSSIIRASAKCSYPVTYLAWDSFEAYVIDETLYSKAPRDPYDCKFSSYEQYASEQLSKILQASLGSPYNKSSLPMCLHTNRCAACDKSHYCAYVDYGNNVLLRGRLREILNNKNSKDVISPELIDRVWNEMPYSVRSMYGTTKEEIATNYYKEYPYLFD